MKKKRKPYIIASIAFLLASTLVAWPMALAYRSTRNEALDRLRFQARALAEQAANGIRAYLSYHYHDLEFLSAVPSVIAMDDNGRELLKAYYREQIGSVRAVTRIDKQGRILWSWPDPAVAGRDVSAQEHNRRFLDKQKPVLSGVFKAVQGYEAVALTVPVREYGEFDGGLVFLIPFEDIASRFVADIAIGESGYAILFDANGVELYCPVPGHIGQNIRQTSVSSPSMLGLYEEMAGGGSGEGEYFYDAIAELRVKSVKKIAHYTSVRFLDSFWTVMVTVPEAEAYTYVAGFQRTWLTLAAILFGGIGFWTGIILRALVRNEDINEALTASNSALRKAAHDLESAQERLVLSEKLATLGQLASAITHQVNTPLAAMASASGNIRASVDMDIQGFIELGCRLAPAEKELFLDMVRSALLHAKSAAAMAGSRARKRRDLAALMEARGYADARHLAEMLGEMGILDRWEDYAPLYGLPHGVELVRHAQGFARIAQSARLIELALERASAVIRALGSYVDAGSGHERCLIDVNEEIDTVLALYLSSAHGGVSLTREYGQDCVVLASPDQLIQVWTNLIVNALQAMQGTGSLFIRSEKRDGRLRVLIEDNGPGIPKELALKVFEPLFTTKTDGQGSGLGLDIAKRVVESLGGSISLESEPGRTVFTVTLPAAEALSGGL
jgi:two-component system, NtrC family, sensor kinase